MSNLPPWVSSGSLQPRRSRRKRRLSDYVPTDVGEALVWVLLIAGVAGVIASIF